MLTSLRYCLVKRIYTGLITLFFVITAIFFTLRTLPGDPAIILAGPLADETEIANVRQRFELEKPVLVQYFNFGKQLFSGKLGTSMRSGSSVLEEIQARLPSTVKLAFAATLLSVIFGIPLGIISAYSRSKVADYIISLSTLFLSSIPAYGIGLILIVIFAVQLKWLPAAGSENIGSIILPSAALASSSVAIIIRMTRFSVLEVLSKDYILTARAKGLSECKVVLKHAMRNVLIPVLTIVGIYFGYLLDGVVITESIFGWPGVGRLLVDSISSRDYPVVQGIVLASAISHISINMILDIVYLFCDPRIEYD